MQKLSKKALRKAEQAIRDTAFHYGVTEEEVREGIKEAIMAGLKSDDPTVQAVWRSIPSAHDIPAPEELIAWESLRVKRML